jgi:hypothetical protein
MMLLLVMLMGMGDILRIWYDNVCSITYRAAVQGHAAAPAKQPADRMAISSYRCYFLIHVSYHVFIVSSVVDLYMIYYSFCCLSVSYLLCIYIYICIYIYMYIYILYIIIYIHISLKNIIVKTCENFLVVPGVPAHSSTGSSRDRPLSRCPWNPSGSPGARPTWRRPSNSATTTPLLFRKKNVFFFLTLISTKQRWISYMIYGLDFKSKRIWL